MLPQLARSAQAWDRRRHHLVPMQLGRALLQKRSGASGVSSSMPWRLRRLLSWRRGVRRRRSARRGALQRRSVARRRRRHTPTHGRRHARRHSSSSAGATRRRRRERRRRARRGASTALRRRRRRRGRQRRGRASRRGETSLMAPVTPARCHACRPRSAASGRSAPVHFSACPRPPGPVSPRRAALFVAYERRERSGGASTRTGSRRHPLNDLNPFLTDEVAADSGGKQRPHVGGSYGVEAGNLLLG